MEPAPEQDIRFGDPESPPTPWSAAVGVLETAELFWISTVRADGRPHVTPLPAVWCAGRLFRRPAALLHRSGGAEGGEPGGEPARGADHRDQPVEGGTRSRGRRQ